MFFEILQILPVHMVRGDSDVPASGVHVADGAVVEQARRLEGILLRAPKNGAQRRITRSRMRGRKRESSNFWNAAFASSLTI